MWFRSIFSSGFWSWIVLVKFIQEPQFSAHQFGSLPLEAWTISSLCCISWSPSCFWSTGVCCESRWSGGSVFWFQCCPCCLGSVLLLNIFFNFGFSNLRPWTCNLFYKFCTLLALLINFLHTQIFNCVHPVPFCLDEFWSVSHWWVVSVVVIEDLMIHLWHENGPGS